jgi:phosphatidylserine/phosphatidylglycerophosphate/cardiolipin synthase-like enzyme
MHFCSYGMSHQLIGALKMASMRVPVYGFASNVDSNTRVELTEYPTEVPGLTAKVIPTEQNIYDSPHQTLLVVDGLVAFKGSTNLTNAGMLRADRGLDLSEIVTNYAYVMELNNTFFAPVWRRITAPGEVFYADYSNPANDW